MLIFQLFLTISERVCFPSVSRHYEGNRSKSQVTRSDFHQAKHLQEDEYLEMMLKYERELQEQIDNDVRIAQQLQEEELRARDAGVEVDMVERDRLLALKLQNKEKQRVLRRRMEKEKRQVERLRSNNSDKSAEYINQNFDLNNAIPDTPSNEVDLSEFCMKPPPGLTEDELSAFQAEQDAELARYLQQQEIKKDALKSQLTVIETQDQELARALQEQEKAKIRKHRERSRAKTSSKVVVNVESRVKTRTHSGSNNSDSTPEYREPYDDNNIYEPNHERVLSSERTPNFHNVAMDLDPTYSKRHSPKEEPQLDENGLHFARLCRVSPCASEGNSPDSTMQSDGDQSADPTAATYLPVAGHRRNSPEKSKKKKSKDGCKTQ